MEMELNGLIEKIKKEGIEEAEKQAEDILQKAQEKAKNIISGAEDQKKAIINEADNESNKLKQQAEDSVKQAVRDTLLMLKQQIVGIFDKVLKREVTEGMTENVLEESIGRIIGNFKKDDSLNIEILLGGKDREKIEKVILDKFTAEIRKGITVRISPEIETGFRIGKKGENYYYDFTDEALAEAFSVYLNPKLKKILDNK